MALTAEDVVKHFRALADTYEEAAQELKVSELRAFLIHEATWLRNVQAAGDPAELLALRVKQAADYLAGLRSLRRPRGKGSDTIRVVTMIAVMWMSGRLGDVVDWIDRLT